MKVPNISRVSNETYVQKSIVLSPGLIFLNVVGYVLYIPTHPTQAAEKQHCVLQLTLKICNPR